MFILVFELVYGLLSGDDRDRTDYLFNAIEALYQLSYIPQIVS